MSTTKKTTDDVCKCGRPACVIEGGALLCGPCFLRLAVRKALAEAGGADGKPAPPAIITA